MPVPERWTQVTGWINHPTVPYTIGRLIVNDDTGIYCLKVGPSLMSVPQDWAKCQDKTGHDRNL